MTWISTGESLPRIGEVVHTKIADANGTRNVQQLKWGGKLWFTPDGEMYVYYMPTHWARETPRPTDAENALLDAMTKAPPM